MMRTLDRFTDEELRAPPSAADALRAFFRDWAVELEQAST
jgi:hypothetical protein